MVTANHVFKSTGSKTVSLCVRDEIGAESCESISVSVAEEVSLAMSVQPTVGEVSVGETVSYQVELVNLEPDIVGNGLVAREVTANFELPPGLTLTDTATGGASCTSGDNMVSCTLGDMEPGDSEVMNIAAINNGSAIFNDDQGFNVVAMTTTDSTKEFYLGYALTTVLADQTDSDGDGMYDVYELANGLNTSTDDSEEDSDGDGLSNQAEFIAGTSANDADTDDDGISDGWEFDNGLSPGLASDAMLDFDEDGFSNLDEYLADRNPNFDEDSGNRLVPVLSLFDDKYLSIPAVQIGTDFYDLELELSGTDPVIFELIGFQQRPIQVEVADANTFDLNSLALKAPVAQVLGELYSLEFVLISDAPVQLQLTAADASTVTP